MRRAVPFVAAALLAACDDAAHAPTTTPEAFIRAVTPTLDPKNPGAAELPGGLLPMPFAWLPWTLAGVAALVGAAYFVRRRASAPGVAAAPAAKPDPSVRARERLAALRARTNDEAWFVEAASVVRDYAAERFEVPATRMTSEQLVAAAKNAPLADVLARCDAVKFAAQTPDAADASRVLDAAEAFVAGART
jgi:hypothetical protein